MFKNWNCTQLPFVTIFIIQYNATEDFLLNRNGFPLRNCCLFPPLKLSLGSHQIFCGIGIFCGRFHRSEHGVVA